MIWKRTVFPVKNYRITIDLKTDTFLRWALDLLVVYEELTTIQTSSIPFTPNYKHFETLDSERRTTDIQSRLNNSVRVPSLRV